jgi:hypothetical protein
MQGINPLQGNTTDWRMSIPINKMAKQHDDSIFIRGLFILHRAHNQSRSRKLVVGSFRSCMAEGAAYSEAAFLLLEPVRDIKVDKLIDGDLDHW